MNKRKTMFSICCEGFINKKIRLFQRCNLLFGALLLLPLLTGCAAGSATAGYALKAREADYLSAQGEQRVTDRVKREILLEWDGCNSAYPCAQKNY